MSLKFVGTYAELQSKLVSLNGKWDDSNPNKKTFKVDDGLMNWFESTGSINFQGKIKAKTELESRVPALLYPSETIFVSPKSIESSDEESVGVPTINQTESLERQFLTTGINEGELIIGIVSTVGTESARIIGPLKDRLKVFGYNVEEIRISSILPDFTGSPSKEYERIKHFMESGDNLRRDSDNNAILASGAMQAICEKRENNSTKTAYILNSLKHPKEVELLRKVYGDGFYLVGIHNDEKRRRRYLTDDKGLKQAEADELIGIDENESIDHGQKTRDTYHLSDFFLNLGKNDDQVKNRLQRFLELIFSHPYKNPTFDEFAMFMAFNSSARSGDLSRQVGAVLCRDNQIIATGANDVPKSGGGLYWAEVNPNTGEICDHVDGKDYTREIDSNKQAQAEIITEIAIKLLDSGVVALDKEIDLRKILKQSKISDLTEFGRIVHAEMDALLSCARAGITTVDSTLYCTTFPCHNCAKHIIASGVKKVLYVEPYPKSRALDFHSESIELNSELDVLPENNSLVTFEPFIGVGPRRFLDLFSMTLGAGSKLKRKAKDGAILDWSKSTAPIRTPIIARSYIQIEASAVEMWSCHNDAMKKII
jgi:deoxycytidylate deaminase